jgi:hypothetical protein
MTKGKLLEVPTDKVVRAVGRSSDVRENNRIYSDVFANRILTLVEDRNTGDQ